MAGSDIEAICREASLSAIRESIQSGHQQNKLEISQKHFKLAMDWLKRQRGE
jgi:SpoVK/Ycf46/Vps4 family AAA+-type ATPase